MKKNILIVWVLFFTNILLGQNYFPLAVGNVWNYSDGSQAEINKTIISRGNTYYCYRVKKCSTCLNEIESYFVIKNNNIYTCQKVDDKFENIVLKQGLSDGDFWIDYLDSSVTCTSYCLGYEDIVIDSTEYVDCLKIESVGEDLPIIYWFAINVGLVKKHFYNQFGEKVELILDSFTINY